MSNWFTGAIVTLITPYINAYFGHYMYVVFGIAGVLMTVCTYQFVPETMGKSLEDMVNF
jgi:hypothetical protein